MNAPIALFTFLRMEVLQETVECLKTNILAKASELYIFSDAAKNDDQRKKIRLASKKKDSPSKK